MRERERGAKRERERERENDNLIPEVKFFKLGTDFHLLLLSSG